MHKHFSEMCSLRVMCSLVNIWAVLIISPDIFLKYTVFFLKNILEQQDFQRFFQNSISDSFCLASDL